MLFFDWLFCDLNLARDRYQRHAALRHNRHNRRMCRMCLYLPTYLLTYLRRWCFLTVCHFGLGLLCERAFQASMLSAWLYTWSSVTLIGMVVISIAWAWLSNARLN